jgi:hypothetical protein
LALSALSAGAIAGDLDAIRITFDTLDCAGERGAASVPVDRIERIEAYTCTGAPADAAGYKLKRVLARTPSGSFDTFLVHAAEAEQIRHRIDRAMESRRRSMESAPRIIVDDNY